jgi:hypothetical protein
MDPTLTTNNFPATVEPDGSVRSRSYILQLAPRLHDLLSLFLSLAVAYSFVHEHPFLLRHPFEDPYLSVIAETALGLFIRLLSSSSRFTAGIYILPLTSNCF